MADQLVDKTADKATVNSAENPLPKLPVKRMEDETNFDFDIRPDPRQVPRRLPPLTREPVTFQVVNTSGRRVQAEAILKPIDAPKGPMGRKLLPGEWVNWLSLEEPAEYDYLPGSIRTYHAWIRTPELVSVGDYSFELVMVGHDDPDNQFVESLPVTFKVAIQPIKLWPWVIVGIVLLLLVIGGAVAAALLIKSGAGLQDTLTIQKQVNANEMALYTFQLNNQLDKTTVDEAVLDYTYPPGVQAAWAEFSTTTDVPVTPRCGSTSTALRCVLGTIQPKEKVTVKIHVLPGPVYPQAQELSADAQATATAAADQALNEQAATPTALSASQVPVDGSIENQNRFVLHWKVNGSLFDKNLTPNSSVTKVKAITDLNRYPVSGAAIPAVDVATVGLPAKIWLVAWSNHSKDTPVVLRYTLPGGMRYTGFDPRCTQLPDYYTLECSGKSLEKFYAMVVPLQPATGLIQKTTGREVSQDNLLSLSGVPTLTAANDQLVFNGVNDWGQLGYVGLPERFTAELWVDPHSIDDGQALIGAHRQIPAKEQVLNTFLVGYYQGSININIMGECYNLDMSKTKAGAKTLDPFHLAVTVDKGQSDDLPVLTAYINGEAVDLQQGTCCRADCNSDYKIKKPAADETDFNWVVGQDWDANGKGIVTSDFFHGAISDVRLYSSVLNQAQVSEDMFMPPPLCTGKKDEVCTRPNLIGWWPMRQTNASMTNPQANCTLAIKGVLNPPSQSSQPAATPINPACTLVDKSLNGYNGARSGGVWESDSANYGMALNFDGRSGVFQPDVVLTDFKPIPNTTMVPVTLSAWVLVNGVPTQPQVIVADMFKPDSSNPELFAIATLGIGSDGRVSASYYTNTSQNCQANAEAFCIKINEMKDLRVVPVGRWTHYAMIFWYDQKTGALTPAAGDRGLLLFRDGENLKDGPTVREEDVQAMQGNICTGFYVGGLQTQDSSVDCGKKPGSLYQPFTGQVDEIRLWNRALFNPADTNTHLASEIDLWRRLPGASFDEYAYWSFDDRSGKATRGPCADAACKTQRNIDLLIAGPSWVPNSLNTVFYGQGNP